jgi:two-component system nitrogen regulation sensor histidine kinase GlnL
MSAVISPDGRCIFANASFENVLGLSRRSVQRGSVFDWFVEAQVLRDTVAAVARNEFSASRLEALLRRPGPAGGDALPVHVIVNQMDGVPHVLVELVEIEQQTRQDREERALGQARATKELIRNLAHEIKNPLGGIRGAAQLLEREFPDPQHGEYTRVIIREADRLQNLVDRLLGPSRPPRRQSLNIHEVLEHVRKLLEAEAPGEVEVARDYDPSIPDLVGDREQLVQALLNLARNALQAVGGRGRILLRSRARRQVTLSGTTHRLVAVMEVEDDGPGVPPELQEKIFYPMVTTRAGGSGLGLPIAQQLAHSHGGLVECRSRPGCTVFSMMVPLERPQ